VRNIFSSAKRISLRPSVLFRQKDAAAALKEEGEYDSPAASHSLPVNASQPASRHTGAFSLDNRDMQVVQPPQPAQLDARVSMAAAVAVALPVGAAAGNTPDTVSSIGASRSCRPPTPTMPLPATPHSQFAAHHAVAQYPQPPEQYVKSPTSYSSKSLGLHSLDFEYNQQAIDMLMPTLPPMLLLQDKAPELSAATLSSLGTGADHTIDLVDIHTLEELDNVSETLRPSDAIPAAHSDANSVSSAFKSCPYSSLMSHRKTRISPTEVIKSLGSVMRICDAALSSTLVAAAAATAMTEAPLTQDNPDFVVPDIDQLLQELGFTNSFIQGADVESANGDAALPLLGSDSDVFSLMEIDELIEQLGNADFAEEITSSSPHFGRSHLVASSSLLVAEATDDIIEDEEGVELDIGLVVGMLGCVERVAEKAVAAEPCAKRVVDPAALVSELGAVVQPSFIKRVFMKQPLIAAETVYELGSVARLVAVVPLVAPKIFPISVDIESTIAELGNVDGLVAVPAMAIDSLAALICGLGNVNNVVSAAIAPLAPAVPNSPHLDIPDIISELGGVYSPEYMVHNVERVRKCSTQTLVGDIDHEIFAKPVGHLLHEFKYSRQFPDIAETKQISAFDRIKCREPSMDVDENIKETRSRATSTVSVANSDTFGNINRLISALRVPPFIVSRPFLGPLRNVLFSDLC
ncbi:hypothetical protein LPJ75_002392, partial [Coemansia sp. RSA 2598]